MPSGGIGHRLRVDRLGGADLAHWEAIGDRDRLHLEAVNDRIRRAFSSIPLTATGRSAWTAPRPSRWRA